MSEPIYQSSHNIADDSMAKEETQRLFGQPDVLCVHDYLYVYQGRAAETPERRLMAAVLRDAIDCFIRDCFAPNRHRKRSYREAEEWFFTGDDHGVFSLDNVCGILNLDPGYIRRTIRRYTEQNAPGVKVPIATRLAQSTRLELQLPLAS
jgi:hypothetical protein